MSADRALAAAVAPGIADLLLEVRRRPRSCSASSVVSPVVSALSPVPLYLLAGLVLGEGGAVVAGRIYRLSCRRRGARADPAAADSWAGVLGRRVRKRPAASCSVRGRGPGPQRHCRARSPVGCCSSRGRRALVMAGVTWVSSSGIVARVVSDLGRLANRETPSVLAVLVLEDIAMAVVPAACRRPGRGWRPSAR